MAERVRIVGNFYYKSEQYVKANAKYKKALRYLMKFQEDAQSLNHDLSPKEEVDVTHAVIHNLLNSAACKIKLQLYDQALENCNEALDSVPNHFKALYRRGQAYHGKREYERAIVSCTLDFWIMYFAGEGEDRDRRRVTRCGQGDGPLGGPEKERPSVGSRKAVS